MDKLIELLSTKDGTVAAKYFPIIIRDDEVLSKSSFADVKFLYRQRFFNHCMPILEAGFMCDSEVVRQNYLLSLISLLPCVPSSLVLEKVEKVNHNKAFRVNLLDLDISDASESFEFIGYWLT